jgi:hypothetical protein
MWNPFKRKVEEDLILGDEVVSDTESDTVDDPVNDLEVRHDIRCDIDAAIAVYTFLEEQDASNPDILRWGLKRKVLRAKKQCLQILCDSINLLQIERDESEEEED